MSDSISVFQGYDYHRARRGHALMDPMGTGELIAWPKCEINGCRGLVAMGVHMSLCYKHGIEFKSFTQEEFDAEEALDFPRFRVVRLEIVE